MKQRVKKIYIVTLLKIYRLVAIITVTHFFYNASFPRADGMELIELGGIIPTSVTTAVILVGGVRSYSGLRISRFGWRACSLGTDGYPFLNRDSHMLGRDTYPARSA